MKQLRAPLSSDVSESPLCRFLKKSQAERKLEEVWKHGWKLELERPTWKDRDRGRRASPSRPKRVETTNVNYGAPL